MFLQREDPIIFLLCDDPIIFLLCDQITKFLKTLLGKFVTVAAIKDSRNDMTQVDFTNEGKQLSGK